MNNRVKTLNVERFMFFDIETVRGNKELVEGSRECELFTYKNRDRVTTEVPDFKTASELYNDTAALNPTFGKIVCISVGFLSGKTLRVKALTGTEVEILTAFLAILSKFEGTIGYNQLRFDLPYIRIRAYANGIGDLFPDKYSDSDCKPWDLTATHVDLMDVTKGSSYLNISLDEACYLFGIQSPKNDISGSQVSEVFYSEGVERVATYCNKDIVATAELFFKLSGRHDEMFNDVIIVGPEPQKSVFEQLKESGSITKELSEKLLAHAKGLLKKDKTKFVNLVKASLGKDSFSVEEEEVFTAILSKK